MHAHRPILTADSVQGHVNRVYRSWLTPPTAGPFWARMEFTPTDFAAIDIPTLTTTGWYDADPPGSLFYCRGLMAHAKDRSKHFLMVGPWEHVETFQGATTKVGENVFSPESVVDNKAIHAAFFDWCLKQTAPGFAVPKAQVYVTGANAWRTYEQYPPAASTPTKLYLTSGGKDNTRNGDGRLVSGGPRDSPPDRFTYDPKNPVPGSMANVAIDRSKLQGRDLPDRALRHRAPVQGGAPRQARDLEQRGAVLQPQPEHRQSRGDRHRVEVARQTIHHHRARASSITLPLMPKATVQ